MWRLTPSYPRLTPSCPTDACLVIADYRIGKVTLCPFCSGIDAGFWAINRAWVRAGLFGGGFGILLDDGADANIYFFGIKFTVSRISLEFKIDATFRNPIMEGVTKIANKVAHYCSLHCTHYCLLQCIHHCLLLSLYTTACYTIHTTPHE